MSIRSLIWNEILELNSKDNPLTSAEMRSENLYWEFEKQTQNDNAPTSLWSSPLCYCTIDKEELCRCFPELLLVEWQIGKIRLELRHPSVEFFLHFRMILSDRQCCLYSHWNIVHISSMCTSSYFNEVSPPPLPPQISLRILTDTRTPHSKNVPVGLMWGLPLFSIESFSLVII